MALGFLETLRPASSSREETTTTTTSSRRRLSLDSCCSGGSDLEEEGVGVRKPDMVVVGYGRGSASAQVDEEKVAFLGRPGQQQTL